MGFKETKAYFENCTSRSALACPFGFAAGRNKLCVCVYHPSFTVEPLCELGRDRARIINDYAYFENHQILSGFDRHSDKFPVHLEVPFNLRPMVNLLRIARGYYPRKTVWCELESSNVVEVSRALGRVMTVRGERIVVTVATRNTCPVKNEGIIHKTHIAPSLSR